MTEISGTQHYLETTLVTVLLQITHSFVEGNFLLGLSPVTFQKRLSQTFLLRVHSYQLVTITDGRVPESKENHNQVD